jgi:hypothetical protein
LKSLIALGPKASDFEEPAFKDAAKKQDMESVFYTFQEFITYTQSMVYLIGAGALVALFLFWRFLTGRDKKKRTF